MNISMRIKYMFYYCKFLYSIYESITLLFLHGDA
jgi:hypothetical protein